MLFVKASFWQVEKLHHTSIHRGLKFQETFLSCSHPIKTFVGFESHWAGTPCTALLLWSHHPFQQIFLFFLLIIFLLFIFFFLTINLLLSSLRSSAFALSFSSSLSSAPAPSFPLFVGDFLFSLFSPLCFLICFQACLLLCNKCYSIYYQWSHVMVIKLTPHHRLKQINEIHTCSQLYKYGYIFM